MSTGTDVGVGDSELVFLDCAPADNTTHAALSVGKPDGTRTTVAVSGGTLTAIAGTSPVQYSQRWTSDQPVIYDQPGKWVLHWAVTGSGEGAEDLEVWVVASPVAGGPTWAPGRSRVAAYVPHRTLARDVTSTTAGADTYQFTFDSTTTPPGVLVDRLIADGIDWVTALITPMNAKSQPTCALLSALWAAIAVERSWPDDDTSLQRATDMEKRLDAMLAALSAANLAANEADGVAAYPPPVAPMWSFPAAPRNDGPYRRSATPVDGQVADLLARIAALEAGQGGPFTYSLSTPDVITADDSAPGVGYTAGVLTVDDTVPGVTGNGSTVTVTT